MTNTLRDKLENGQPVIGACCAIGSVESAEMAADAGFDFVMLDSQHAPMDLAWLRHALRALDAVGGDAVVRTIAPDPQWLGPLLDMGYRTVGAPMVNTPSQAEAIARACRYPPRGTRSMGASRASIRHGIDHHRTVDDDVLVFVTIESIEAVENIEAIAAVDGIDIAFIGSVDLALSMGCRPGDPMPPELDAHAARVRDAFAAAGKWSMIGAGTPDDVKRRIDEGYPMIMGPSDLRLLWAAWRGFVDGSRKA